ncbi:MAG TPA: sulfurtransferase TusA family protein [Pseudomonadales bacterium]
MSALETLDTRGLLCPLPVIRTQDRIRGLPAGTELEVIATDPGTQQDIPAWCRVHGHALLESHTLEQEPNGARLYCFRIKVQK